MSWQETRKDERGFTLAEVLVVIIVIGILTGIASSTWFGVIQSRNVDSATNQVSADLRMVHTQATDRLAEYRFLVTGNNTSTYQVGPSLGPLTTKTLPDGTLITAPVDIRFKSDGSAAVISGTTPITVKLSADPTNNHTVNVNVVTSRIQVVP